MSEQLIIKNFGPIKEVSLDVRRVNILIGEQATGKSTVVKVLAVCRYFSYIVEDGSYLRIGTSNKLLEGLSDWGLDESIRQNSYIYYKCDHYSVTIEWVLSGMPHHDLDKQEHISNLPVFVCKIQAFSKKFETLLAELDKIRPKDVADLAHWRIPTSFFINDVAQVIDNPFFLPTERGLQSIFYLGSASNISSSLFNQLGKIDEIAKSFTKDTSIEPLDIVYKNQPSTGYGSVRKNHENNYVSLSKGASGYQSLIPVVLSIKYYNEVKKKRKTFIVEEPELNLFPTAQQRLIGYMVENVIKYGHSLLMATHSPYVLTSLNNLMYAEQIGKFERSKTEEIIGVQYWINPDDVSAYKMSDGSCEDIVDREQGLVKADKIDEVSRTLNKQFDDLLTIEYSKK